LDDWVAAMPCLEGVGAAVRMLELAFAPESLRSSISSSKSGVLYENVLNVPAFFNRAIASLTCAIVRAVAPIIGAIFFFTLEIGLALGLLGCGIFFVAMAINKGLIFSLMKYKVSSDEMI
jgi:hypothetical protein